MRAVIFRCFVCGKPTPVIAEIPDTQPMPLPPGWQFMTVFVQHSQTGVFTQVAVPMCKSPCDRPSQDFLDRALATVQFLNLGTVVQSAPCVAIDVAEPKAEAGSKLSS